MARVLLVEDEIPVLILAESVVQGLGHDTYSAASKTEALNLFADHGDIDALFTDIRLPEGDLAGLELAQEAREIKPDLKVLYTTGSTMTDGMKTMFVEGSRFLPKPYTVEDMTVAIASLVSR
jgi:CheY-like chemotaxis protein